MGSGALTGFEVRVSSGESIQIGRPRREEASGAADLSIDFPGDSGGEPGGLAELTRRLLERNQQLELALTSRVVIEQAKGVLAERFVLHPEDAFEILRRAARNHRMKIHDLAADVVGSRATPHQIKEVLPT